jgi:hypothetical protein
LVLFAPSFPFLPCRTSIPVFSVIVRYNILQSGWKWLSGDGRLGMFPAHFISIGVPWLLSIVFYPGDALTTVINWSSALLFVPINLLFPFFLYVRRRRGAMACASHPDAAKVDVEVEIPEEVGGGGASAAAADKAASIGLLADSVHHTPALAAAMAASSDGSVDGGAGGSINSVMPSFPPNNEPMEDIKPLVPLFCCCARKLGKAEHRIALYSLYASLLVAILAIVLQGIASGQSQSSS